MNVGDSLQRIDDDDYERLLETQRFVLLCFAAEWCAPCYGAVSPVLEELDETFDGLTVGILDVETGERAVDAFDVETLLTKVLLRDGEEVDRFRGKTPYVVLERAVREHR